MSLLFKFEFIGIPIYLLGVIYIYCISYHFFE